MKKRHIIIIACVAVMALIICGIVFGPKILGTSPGEPTVVPAPTETPAPTDSPTPTEEPTETPAPTEELTPTEEVVPTEEPTPTEEPLPTDSPTPVPTNTATPSPTQKPAEPTKEPTKVPTKEPTKAPTNSPTPTEVVQEQPYKMWVKDGSIEVYAPDTSFTQIGTLERGAEVTVIHTNVLNRQVNYISEIRWGNGTAYIQYDALSKTYVEGKWSEPRERKDISDALMNLVNNYRIQSGIRRYESPYIYYDINNPGLGDRLKAKGLRVAKKCCLELSANHEGGQIATGVYNDYASPASAAALAQRLFENWKGSSLHNASMLYDGGGEDIWVPVALVTVVEWYDGSHYQYCAIMSHTYIGKAELPDGLE